MGRNEIADVFVPPAPRPLLAAGLTICASALAAASTLLAKTLTTGALGPALSPLQVSFARYLFAFLIVTSAVALLRPRLVRPDWIGHLGRSGFGWLGVTLMFAAATYIPLADATAISFLNPVFAMILAALFLAERVGPWRWAGAAIALSGALILLRPTPAAFQPAALLALAAAVFIGIEITFMKRLVRRERALQVLFVNNGVGTLIAALGAAFVWLTPSPLQWLVLAGVGTSMVAAQTCFVNALARADSSYVTPFFYATLVFAALYDGWLFGIWPGWISILGMVVILGGALLLAWRENRAGTIPVRPDRVL